MRSEFVHQSPREGFGHLHGKGFGPQEPGHPEVVGGKQLRFGFPPMRSNNRPVSLL